MPRPTISKPHAGWKLAPNRVDYAAARESFSWEAACRELSGLPGGGLNIAHEAVDRHVLEGRGDRMAIRWLDKTGRLQDITYADLTTLTNRFGNLLRGLGVSKGDRICTLAGRIPELYITLWERSRPVLYSARSFQPYPS